MNRHDFHEIPVPPAPADGSSAEQSTPARTVIYTRSGSASVDEASRTQQLRGCRAAAAMRGLTIIEEVHDRGVPGTTSVSRPGWSRVLELIRGDRVDYVLSFEFARITSSWDDIPELLDLSRAHHVDFLAVDLDLRVVPVLDATSHPDQRWPAAQSDRPSRIRFGTWWRWRKPKAANDGMADEGSIE